MQAFAKLFREDVRKKISSTDWNDPESVRYKFPSPSGEEYAEFKVCPIGMALIESIGKRKTSLSMPFSGYVLDVIRSMPDSFLTTNGELLSSQREISLKKQIAEFMNEYDNGRMSNEHIAEAFGYPELAHKTTRS